MNTLCPGPYVNKNKNLCLEYEGLSCIRCAWNLGYFMYGNECVRFENRSSDQIQPGPNPRLLRGIKPLCLKISDFYFSL